MSSIGSASTSPSLGVSARAGGMPATSATSAAPRPSPSSFPFLLSCPRWRPAAAARQTRQRPAPPGACQGRGRDRLAQPVGPSSARRASASQSSSRGGWCRDRRSRGCCGCRRRRSSRHPVPAAPGCEVSTNRRSGVRSCAMSRSREWSVGDDGHARLRRHHLAPSREQPLRRRPGRCGAGGRLPAAQVPGRADQPVVGPAGARQCGRVGDLRRRHRARCVRAPTHAAG